MVKPADKKPKKENKLKTHGKSGQAHGRAGAAGKGAGGLKLSVADLTTLSSALTSALAAVPASAYAGAWVILKSRVDVALTAATAGPSEEDVDDESVDS